MSPSHLVRWWRRDGGGREVLVLALPLILSNSFWTLQITIDRVLLSQYGSDEIAAAMPAVLMFWTPLVLLQNTAGYATTFAAQYLGCEKLLGLDREKVNVNGGAIALGHPLGATGTRILYSLARELKARGAKYGIASACIGGGQGIAVLLKNPAA